MFQFINVYVRNPEKKLNDLKNVARNNQLVLWNLNWI